MTTTIHVVLRPYQSDETKRRVALAAGVDPRHHQCCPNVWHTCIVRDLETEEISRIVPPLKLDEAVERVDIR